MKGKMCHHFSIISISLLSLHIVATMAADHKMRNIQIDGLNGGRECSGHNRTVFLRTDGAQMEGVEPLETITALSMQQCARECMEGEIGRARCRSFEYDSENLLCILKTEDSQPFGRGVLSASKMERNSNKMGQQQHATAIAHFQRICLPNTNLLCPSAHVFERFPQYVLIGHALEVRSVAGLSECLANCLEAKAQLRLDCQSVMYFYESGTCLLNRERRRTVGEAMFREETGTELVDYFESVCVDVECSSGAELHWIRTEHFQIDPSREVILGEEFQLEQCRQLCISNQLYESPFPCKAFVHSTSSGQCQLSAESGIRDSFGLRHRKKRKQRRIDNSANIVESGEASSPADHPPSGEVVGAELSAFSSGQYYEKILIASTVANCLSACLLSASDCRSVQFRKDRDECVLSSLSQLSHPELFHPAKSVDYYDNLCALSKNDGRQKITSKFIPSSSSSSTTTTLPMSSSSYPSSSSISSPILRPSLLPSSGKLAFASLTLEKRKRLRPEMETEDEDEGAVGRKIGEKSEMAKKNLSENLWTKAVIGTECRLRGIEVHARFPVPSSGSLFLSDHANNCRAHFQNALMAVLLLPHPASNGTNAEECPGKQLGPDLWSYVIILQQKKDGEQIIDSPVLTGQERLFNVTCDFSNLHYSSNDSFYDNTTVSPTQPPAPSNSGSSAPSLPSKVQLRMSLLREGLPVSAVVLGEELELRWTFGDGTHNSGLGMFVESCLAERIDGDPPDPPPLALIVDGCPEAKVYAAHLISSPIQSRHNGDGFNTSLRVFRFDGSRRVRIRCAVNVCVEKCSPVNCMSTRMFTLEDEVDSDSEVSVSYGRRRRKRGNSDGTPSSMGMTTLGELAELVERYDRIRGDALPGGEKTKANNNVRTSSPIQQSTTISGSYTILENEQQQQQQQQEEEGGRDDQRAHISPSGGGSKSFKRIKVMRGGGKRRDDEEEDELEDEAGEDEGREELISLMGATTSGRKDDQQQQKQRQQVVLPVMGKLDSKKGDSYYKAPSDDSNKASGGSRLHTKLAPTSACEQNPSDGQSEPSSSICVVRPFAVLCFVALVTLAILQCFQIGRHLRKKFADVKANVGEEEAVPAEMEQHPPAPTSAISPSSAELDNFSVECGFRRGNRCWHKTNALCAQEQCRHCHWDDDDNGGRGNFPQLYGHHRHPSLLSWADVDEFVEGGDPPMRERGFQHQRRTVFPAEPIPPSPLRNTRRRQFMETV